MAKVFLLHWHRSEAEERAVPLRQAGHAVSLHWSTETGPDLKEALPDVVVISLDRLPSHGRAVAEWLWEAKKRQHIPIVFAGGARDKVAATRAKFPRAVFCPTLALVGRIGQLPPAPTSTPRRGKDPAAGAKRSRSARAARTAGDAEPQTDSNQRRRRP